METKLDKVLDILNMFEFFYGQRAGRELWADKPVEVQNQDIDNFVKNIKYIKDFLNDSVVLSKEKYELLVACSSYEGVMKALKNEYTKGSKETAEKILQEGRRNISRSLRDWIIEQFGVEIRE